MILIGMQSEDDLMQSRHYKFGEEQSLVNATSSCYGQNESTQIR